MKRFTCALLALLMLAGTIVAPTPVAASGAEVTPIATSEICSCGCETKLSEIRWTLWDPNNAVNSVSGHYYLAEDYAQDKPMDVKPNVRIVLDLRGHTLTQAKENIRLFMIYGYVAVIDTVGSGRILTKPGQSGGAVYVRLDTVAMNEALDGTFAIYNCTMAQDAGTKTSANGGFVFLEDNVNFKAFGARFMSASVSSRGGAIYGGSTSTRIEMTDSSILDCYAASRGGAIYAQGHVTLDGCHLTGNSASYGGNIALESAVSSLTVKNNSIIENGVATSSKYGGGNIYDHSSSTVNISDSTIRNGYTAHYGGNISFCNGTYTLTNTTISGGVAAFDGANLYLNKSAGRVTIDSCNISGDFTFGSGHLTLKGETKIGLNNNGLKLLYGSSVITANELTDGAEIYIDAQGTFTGTGVNSDYFKPALRTVISAAQAAYEGVYPYEQWALTETTQDKGYTKSLAGYQWNTLYGTVKAPELQSGELRYNVYLPTNFDPDKEYPLVVYLHNSNTAYNQSSLTPWTSCINNTRHKMGDELLAVMGDYIIFAPQVPGTPTGFAAGDAWSNMTSEQWKLSSKDQTGSSYYLKAAEKKMAEFIKNGITLGEKTATVDVQRVYLCGDSMGAIGAYAMLADCPTTFAGVTIRAGIGDPDKAYLWKDTPVRILHGDQDANVPYEASTLMIEALQAAGAKDAERITVVGGVHDIMDVTYQTFDETGKNVYMSWLAEQIREDAVLPIVEKANSKPASKDNTPAGLKLLTGTQTNGSTAGYCPHCGQQVAWNAFTGNGTAAGHYYLTKDQSSTSAYQISSDIVLDLDGYDITSTDRAFTVTNSGALTLLDRKGGSLINGKGNTDGLGGVISSAGTLRIYKGSYTYTADEAKPLTNGGVIYATGTVNIHGGFFDGSAFNRTDEGCKGGAIYLAEEAGSFTMSAARIVGGTAYTAGGVYLGANNNVTVTGGSVTGGTATNTAGNFVLAGISAKRNGTASISGLSLTDGTAQVEGGNFYLAYYKQFPMTDCYFAGGTSQTSKGGNIYFGTCSYTTLTNTILLNGTASMGGNIHSNSNAAVITLVDCLVTNGAAGNGGNLYLQNGLITLQGGEYSYGTAVKNGGNINNATGSRDDDCLIIAKNDSGKAPVIAKGTATENGGNIYTNGILTLQAGTFHNGTAASGQDIYHNSSNVSMLNIGAELTGQLSMAVASGNLGSGIFGQPIAKTSATALNARLILENLEGKPQACLSDGQLYVSSATVKTADGTEVWYKSNADALNACPADGWIQLYSTQPLVLTKDCFVDLAGKHIEVSGNYTIYGMDTSGDDYSVSAGNIQLSGGAVAAAATDAPNGNRYIAIVDGSNVSYHRLDMQLTTVSIRPDECGIYYSGTWGCDSALLQQIASYGIAVSLYNMPDTQFETDETCLYTRYEGTQLTSGETKTGVLIRNIMKETLSSFQNNRRGTMPIYATGYVKLANGAVYTGDKEGAEDDIAFSLRTTMERMDSLIAQDPSLFLSDTVNAARAFRAKWDNLGMENWVFDKLADPQDDGILKIMILGSSRSVNTFRLLYEVFKDQMPDQEFVFGIMYYSGCSMTMHMNFIKNNSYVYDYYCNDSGRWKITSGVNMDTGLYAHNWDVILLQAGTGDLANQMNLSTRNFLKDYIDDRMLEPYDLWWHSTWFNSTDPELNPNGATVDQVAQLKETNDAARAYVLDDPMFAGHIASGTPVLYAIKELNVPENKLFRDHTHLYDFGCLLVGYSFYAQFTGKPVTRINLDKIPDYLRIREHVALGDVPVTEEDKQIIIDAVAYTMQDPWAVPGAE